MPGLRERLRRLISPEAAERGAEDDVIARAPESVRDRLRAITQRRRQAEEDRKAEAGGGVFAARRRAVREAEEAG